MSSQLALSTEIKFHPLKPGKLRILSSRRCRWLLLSLLSTLLSLLLAKVVEAKIEHHIDRAALDFSRSLSGAFETLHSSDAPKRQAQRSTVYRLSANGLGLLVQTAHITAKSSELDEIFSTFAQRCQQPINEKTPVSTDELPLFDAPLIEARGEKESYLYCLRPKRPINAEGIQAALMEFSDDQDLSAVGQFQGLYLRSDGDRHQLLIMQTDGPALLKQAFSSQKDAPGADMDQLPRPSGRRNLSLLYNDQPHFNSYVMQQSSNEALALYTEQLRANGVSLLSPSRSLSAKKKSLIARTANDTYLIIAHEPRIRESTSSSSPPPVPGSLLSVTRLVR